MLFSGHSTLLWFKKTISPGMHAYKVYKCQTAFYTTIILTIITMMQSSLEEFRLLGWMTIFVLSLISFGVAWEKSSVITITHVQSLDWSYHITLFYFNMLVMSSLHPCTSFAKQFCPAKHLCHCSFFETFGKCVRSFLGSGCLVIHRLV